nr:proline-rich receptor-like protein kinase PERK2 [Aegilops tauschii subsp. strangulata]
MSSSTPTPLPIITTAPLTTAGSPPPPATVIVTTAGSPTPPAPITSAAPTTAVFTPEEATSILRDLVTAVRGIHLYLAGPPAPPLAATTAAYGHPALPWPSQGTPVMGGPPLPPFQAGHPSRPPPPLLHLPWYSWPAPVLAAPSTPAPAPQWPHWPAPDQLPPPPPSSELGQSTLGGLLIQQVQFPPSPSQIPAWLTGASPPPVYTEAGDPPVPTLQSGASSGSAGAYDGLPTVDRAPSSSLLCTAEPVGHGAPTQTPPRFAKIDFATYDGTEDPLNWLNQCEQFFRGQRTLTSEHTWLASYHLHDAAQTWYYALEQDEGSMPPWERFRELCLLRFGPRSAGAAWRS